MTAFAIRTLLAALLLAVSAAAGAEEYRRIQNRWKPDQHLHIERGGIESGRIQPGWWSAMWMVEPVPGTPYVRLRNRWKPTEYLHIERGPLQSGRIEIGWHSAMWSLEPADAGSQRIRNRWKTGQYIHIEYGNPVAGPIERGWWSAMWYLARP